MGGCRHPELNGSVGIDTGLVAGDATCVVSKTNAGPITADGEQRLKHDQLMKLKELADAAAQQRLRPLPIGS